MSEQISPGENMVPPKYYSDGFMPGTPTPLTGGESDKYIENLIRLNDRREDILKRLSKVEPLSGHEVVEIDGVLTWRMKAGPTTLATEPGEQAQLEG